MIKIVTGEELTVGDTIEVGYQRHAVISEITPYAGKLGHLWPKGAQTVKFSSGSLPLVIGNDEPFKLIKRSDAIALLIEELENCGAEAWQEGQSPNPPSGMKSQMAIDAWKRGYNRAALEFDSELLK